MTIANEFKHGICSNAITDFTHINTDEQIEKYLYEIVHVYDRFQIVWLAITHKIRTPYFNEIHIADNQADYWQR